MDKTSLLINYTFTRNNLKTKLDTFVNIVTNEDDRFALFLTITKPDIGQVLDNIGKLGDEFNAIAENMFGMFENNNWETIESKLTVFFDVCERYEKELDTYIDYYEEYIELS